MTRNMRITGAGLLAAIALLALARIAFWTHSFPGHKESPVSHGRLTLGEGRNVVSSVCFSCDNRFLTSGDGQEGEVTVWELVSGAPSFRIPKNGDSVTAITCAPDSLLFGIAFLNSGLVLWDATHGKVRSLTEAGPTADAIHEVAFSRDGRFIATSGTDNQIRIWEVSSGRLSHTLEGYNLIGSLVFSPDGKWLVAGSFGLANSESENPRNAFWSTTDWERKVILDRHCGHLLACSSDSKNLASLGAHGLFLWNIGSLRLEGSNKRPAGYRASGRGISFFDESRRLVTVSNTAWNEPGIIEILDTKSLTVERTIKAHRDGVLTLAVSKDGKMAATGGRDGYVEIWDTKDWAENKGE